MSDITLKNGLEVSFDLDLITIDEYEKIGTSQNNKDVINPLARAAGLQPEQISGLSINDFKLLLTAFHKKVREPVANPT